MIETDRALAPLNAASAAVDKLDTYRTPQELAESLQAIGQAVERSLRQLLRADTSAPDEMRLAALSNTELPPDRLITALRKHDLISIPLAGMIHDLQQAIARAATNDVRATDADNARNTVRRLREDIQTRADAPMREVATSAVTRGDIEEAPHAVTTNGRSFKGRAVLPIIAVAILIAIWLVIRTVHMHLSGGGADMKAGIAAFEQHNWSAAEQDFRAVIETDSKNVTARLYLGRVLRSEGRAKDAGVVLNDARKLAPKDADVMGELGGVFMDLKNPAAAADAYRQAEELDPKNASNWVGLVRALRAAGDPSAEDVMQRAPADAQAILRSQP